MVDIFRGKESYSGAEQLDKNNPYYTIICDDNIHVQGGGIEVETRRFKTPRGAADWSVFHAVKKAWNGWTVTGPAGEIIYQRDRLRNYEFKGY